MTEDKGFFSYANEVAAAMEYANLIEPVPGESYKETCRRLAEAVGDGVRPKIFHKAAYLDLVRSKKVSSKKVFKNGNH